MTYENILFQLEDRVGIVTMNRPKALNALNPKTLEELGNLLEHVREEGDTHVLVLTGAGEKAFVAGADISEFPRMNPLQARFFAEKGRKSFLCSNSFPYPSLPVSTVLRWGRV